MRYLFLIALVALMPAPALANAEVLAVIVPQSHAGHLPKPQELALIFKRKKLYWDDGSRIQPVNLPADHPLRSEFSQRVLKSLPEAQAQYWNSMYYHGVFPPHVVASPEAVLRYVAETDGAIGYAAACKIDARVKPVLWINSTGVIVDVPPAMDCMEH